MNSQKKKTYKCIFCDKVYINEDSLYIHMEKDHKEQLKGLSAKHVYFNNKNKYDLYKKFGKCIICGKNTVFNEDIGKYERLCNNPECKEKFRENFLKNMKRAGKENQMNDPEHQKKMLANRKISGTYIWSTNKKFKFTYTGSYEHEFLEFMDIFLHWNPSDLLMPAPMSIKYKYNGKTHFYLPDAFIPSANSGNINSGCIIEIKSSTNKHYRERDIKQEREKDKAIENTDFNYIKVFDKEYDDFFKKLFEYEKSL